MTRVTPQEQEVQIAQARLPKKLPNTASDMPLFLLMGLTYLGLGPVVRFASPRKR